ncbi:MAG: phosphoenolpyruvate carboxykinase (ATP), partial [Cyclobacteriaceae bacterium]
QDAIFGLHIPKYIEDIPAEILNPINAWKDKGKYISKAIQLAHSFHINFEKFESQANEQILEGGPLIDEHHHLEESI